MKMGRKKSTEIKKANGQKHMKRGSRLLIIREMKMKTKVGYHFPSIVLWKR